MVLKSTVAGHLASSSIVAYGIELGFEFEIGQRALA